MRGARVGRVAQGTPLKAKVGPDCLYLRRQLSIPAACGMRVNAIGAVWKEKCPLVWSLWMVGVRQTDLEFPSSIL